MRNSGCEADFDLALIVIYSNKLQFRHIQLLKSQWVLGVVDFANEVCLGEQSGPGKHEPNISRLSMASTASSSVSKLAFPRVVLWTS